MPLSNKCVSLFALVLAVAIVPACGSKDAVTNTAPAPASNTAANGELTAGEQPFAAKEPDVYQTEVYYTSMGSTDKYFVARNGDTRRVDTYVNGKLSVTELIKDNKRYVIDHVRKMYYVDPPSDKGPKAVNPAAIAFFQNTQHHEFDEIGRGDGTITYHAKKQAGDPDQDVTITIDQKTGLMVHQEVKTPDPKQALVFELKNVKLEAPEDLFQIPAGYKEVTKEQFNPNQKKANANANANAASQDQPDLDVRKAHG